MVVVAHDDEGTDVVVVEAEDETGVQALQQGAVVELRIDDAEDAIDGLGELGLFDVVLVVERVEIGAEVGAPDQVDGDLLRQLETASFAHGAAELAQQVDVDGVG